MSFFVLSLYLFVSSFFYSTGSVVFLLALAFAGVFVGLSASSRPKGEVSISFLNDHRKSFFSILFLVLTIVVSAVIFFKYAQRVVSISYFRKALTAQTLPEAENSISRALTLHINDLYLRTYSEIYLLKLNSLLQKGEAISEAEKADLQVSLDQAVNSAQLATSYNPKNYLNFRALGAVYQIAGTIGVKDSYGRAVQAYSVASTLNPNNPGLKLDMANMSSALKKNTEAKNYADAALALKPDYIDAMLVRSQIAKSEGDNAGAISYAERALALAPSNENLIKYVEALRKPSSPSPVPPTSTTSSSE
jgi:tetratricopeptide (TPR) repeat protein